MNIAEYKTWFNSKAILTPADKMKKRVFAEFGAYTRTVARNSMVDVNVSADQRAKRDRKLNRTGFVLSGDRKVSMPGSPAFSRLGHVKRHIYFAADQNNVVIGPALLNGVKSRNAVEVLEHGGTEQIQVGKAIKVSITAQYKARPTMGLAFGKAVNKKLPKLIENGIMREV